jgi:histidyl-tRNA synthetase
MALQPVRGTRDLRGDELKSFLEIIATARSVSALYGFEEIETPIFESTDVFSRTLGDASDIVTKEMYTFSDKSGDSLTLRPEGTACIVRSVISESLFRELPLKYFYQGPMFRHERPQKGRYRQFYQIGAELIGVPSAIADAEVISLAWTIFKNLKIEQKIQLEINSIGDTESRSQYRSALTDYFKKHESHLSEDSRNRLEKNPLRILDSKSEEDKALVEKAPKMMDHMNAASKDFFNQLQNHLKALEIPFVLNDKLVRGLDYYCHTVFEFTTTALGAQNAVLSGGRYDGLIETMGGPSTPGVGWGGGIDRLALLSAMTFDQPAVIGVIPLTPDNETEALRIMEEIRRAGWPAQMPYSGNLSKRLKKLDRINCIGALIVGGDEEAKGQVQFKDFKSSGQMAIAKKDLLPFLNTHLFSNRP